jgi:hypothetical protein
MVVGFWRDTRLQKSHGAGGFPGVAGYSTLVPNIIRSDCVKEAIEHTTLRAEQSLTTYVSAMQCSGEAVISPGDADVDATFMFPRLLFS